MVHSVSCPDADRLRALITDPDLPDYADLETHLAHCSRCQARLDEIAVGESGWLKDAGRLATGTRTDPELTKTLHRLHDFGMDDSHVPPISLDFLTRSDQPGLLGTLGRYQVLDVIGRGAMGIVLKAIDPDLLRPVAIKVLAPYLASSGTARQRFLREARAAAAVSHDHIVTIHAVEPGELPYIVMEFISGISLQARLDRDGPLPPRDIARIGHQAACGLAAAHAVGLVHRDIKPANILLENGVERVKITDFGLARAADDARLTQSGTAAGTPLYMSPEQARGETVDHRSDLFSLGAVLYTLATGFPPFRAGSTMGVLNRIANDPPRPIRETVPDFPAALEAIIMQLLEKDPAKRFQVAADVSVKLTGYLNDPQAEPRRPRRRLPKWWESSLPILAGILVLGTVLYFKTPRGTLVVETEDPAISVRIVGDELSISGAGPQVVSLKPGVYQVHAADRFGKDMAVDPQVVTIERNGKQIVKVTVKPNEPAPAATDKPTDADLKRMEQELGRLMKQLVDTGKLKPGESDPLAAELSALMLEASKQGNSPEKTREAVLEAYKVAQRITQRMSAAGSDPKADALLEQRLKNIVPDPAVDRLDLMRQALKVGRSKVDIVHTPWNPEVPQTHPQFKRLTELVAEGASGETAPDRVKAALKEAYDLAGTILKESAPPPVAPVKRNPPPADPEWGPRLDELMKRFQDVAARLAKTSAGPVMLIPGPIKDPDKAVAGVKETDRELVKRLLVLRDQFGLLVPRVQQASMRLAELRGKAPGPQVEQVEAGLRTQYDALATALKDIEALAAELDAKSPATGIDWDARLKKLIDEGEGLLDEAGKTPIGRVVELTKTGTKPDLTNLGDLLAVSLSPTDTERARRLLALRDQFGEAASQFRKAIGPWEQARLAASTAKIKEEAGAIPSTEREKAELTLKDAERNLSAAERAAEKVLSELRPLVSALKTSHPWDADEAELKKIMAEYDALKLRLVNTPTGRVLALVDYESPSESQLRDNGVPEAGLPTARKLISLRAKIQAQRIEAENHMFKLQASANRGEAGSSTDIQGLKFRNGALRGLVDDLKKITDELDPPPTVNDEFKKVMGEYDALVLRLAKHPIGRALALFPAGKSWTADQLNDAFPNSNDLSRANGLLHKRGQILAQVDAAEKALTARTNELQTLKEHSEWTSEYKALQNESIRKHEHEAKVATAALRTFVEDLKKLADEIDPPKGK